MGARPDDYKAVAPHHSFIHVDQFKGPRELAEYLLELDRDDEKYNQYFQWKGTGEFINTRFFCRVCAMMHNKKVDKECFCSVYDCYFRMLVISILISIIGGEETGCVPMLAGGCLRR